jgi:hypothetical protein
MHIATAGCCSCGDPTCPAPGKHTHGPWKNRMLVAAGIDQRWSAPKWSGGTTKL